MGSDASAILFWGFPLPTKNYDESDFDPDDWKDRYAVAKGATAPPPEYTEATKPAHHAFWEKRHERVAASGCDIERYGSGDSGDVDYAAAIKESVITVDWGDSRKLEPLLVKANWQLRLKDFCDTMKIAYQEPGWYLVAYYG